jgi:hypothetical protein
MNCNKKHTNDLRGNFRVLSLDEKKNLTWNSTIYIQGNCGCFRTVRVNGKAKTWKRDATRVQIPYKYGLYEYGYITENDEVRVSA